MKMLFLGGIFSKEKEEEIFRKSKSVIQYAANTFQWNLINGFINNDKTNIEILSAPFVGTYPNDYDDLFIKPFSALYKNKIKSNYISFCNLWGFRNISRKNSLKKSISDFILERDNIKVIVVYSAHTSFFRSCNLCKARRPCDTHLFNCYGICLNS